MLIFRINRGREQTIEEKFYYYTSWKNSESKNMPHTDDKNYKTENGCRKAFLKKFKSAVETSGSLKDFKIN